MNPMHVCGFEIAVYPFCSNAVGHCKKIPSKLTNYPTTHEWVAKFFNGHRNCIASFRETILNFSLLIYFLKEGWYSRNLKSTRKWFSCIKFSESNTELAIRLWCSPHTSPIREAQNWLGLSAQNWVGTSLYLKIGWSTTSRFKFLTVSRLGIA